MGRKGEEKGKKKNTKEAVEALGSPVFRVPPGGMGAAVEAGSEGVKK